MLLARHTYGAGKDFLIVPGGYLNLYETPEDAVKREFLEETGVVIEPKNIIAVRFNLKDVDEALNRSDVPELTKKLIEAAININSPFEKKEFISRENHGTYSLYTK